MLWSTLFVSLTGLAACVSAAAAGKPKPTPTTAALTPGVAPSPFPTEAENARITIDATKACAQADDKSQPRAVQLAAWLECQILAFYPYPRDPKNLSDTSEWEKGYYDTFHPTLRASFNSTRFDYTTFIQVYRVFSGAIAESYGDKWHPWRDFYVVSADAFDPSSRGGVVTGMGYNGGILKATKKPYYAPNAGYFVVKEIDGRRWITEIREHSTLNGSPLPEIWPKAGQDQRPWVYRADYESLTPEQKSAICSPSSIASA